MRISGAVKKRARNVNPAALSAGQLSDGTSEKTAEIEKLGKLVKTARKLLPAYSVKRGADRKIVAYRQRLIKRGILKHYADAPLERLHVFFGVRAAYRDAASVLFKQAAHYRYCRAFSRAVYAEKSKKLATPYAEAESRTARISPKDFVRFLISMIFCIVFSFRIDVCFMSAVGPTAKDITRLTLYPAKVRLSICFL